MAASPGGAAGGALARRARGAYTWPMILVATLAAFAFAARAQDLGDAQSRASALLAKPKVLSVVAAAHDPQTGAECVRITRRALAGKDAPKAGTPDNPILYVAEWLLVPSRKSLAADQRPPGPVTILSLSAPNGAVSEPPAAAFKIGLGCTIGAARWPLMEGHGTAARGNYYARAYVELDPGAGPTRVCIGSLAYWGMSSEQAQKECSEQQRRYPGP